MIKITGDSAVERSIKTQPSCRKVNKIYCQGRTKTPQFHPLPCPQGYPRTPRTTIIPQWCSIHTWVCILLSPFVGSKCDPIDILLHNNWILSRAWQEVGEVSNLYFIISSNKKQMQIDSEFVQD